MIFVRMSSEAYYILYYNSDGITVCGERIPPKKVTEPEPTLNVPDVPETHPLNKCIKESKHILH